MKIYIIRSYRYIHSMCMYVQLYARLEEIEADKAPAK